MGRINQTDNISLVDLLSEAFKIQNCNAENLIFVVNTMPLEDEPNIVVHVGKKGSLSIVTVRWNVASEQREMLFEPKCNLPAGLEIFPALVDVLAGASKIVKVMIQKSTKHDMFLHPKTFLGYTGEIAESKHVNIIPTSGEPVGQSNNAPLCPSHVSSV